MSGEKIQTKPVTLAMELLVDRNGRPACATEGRSCLFLRSNTMARTTFCTYARAHVDQRDDYPDSIAPCNGCPLWTEEEEAEMALDALRANQGGAEHGKV